jgi:hypothetical protein
LADDTFHFATFIGSRLISIFRVYKKCVQNIEMSNSSNSGGILGAFGNAMSGLKNAVVGTNSKNNTKKNNSVKQPLIQRETAEGSALPVTAGVNAPTTAPNQTGGVAPLNFRYPANMQQPSEAVMRWATTAGMPAPANMRGVAQGGGKRSTGKRSTKRRSTKRHSTKRKTHMR